MKSEKMMKITLQITVMLLLSLVTYAQQNKKFNPDKFKREQESFITQEAKLTPQEAAAFFPVFKEYQEKQRVLFKQQKQYAKSRPQNDREAEKLISNMDELDSRIKKIQAQYHAKFCKVIPATKVFKCIQAEEKFKHNIMHRMLQQKNNHNNKLDRPKPHKSNK